MPKTNEYVGVDEKYIPEEAKKRTHVQEPIIGSENAQKIRDGITSGVNKLTSDEGKAKVKSGAKKGVKILKGVGIGYLVLYCLMILLGIAMAVFVIVMFINTNNKINDTSDTGAQSYEATLENIENSRKEAEEQYNETMKAVQEQMENNAREMEQRRNAINGE